MDDDVEAEETQVLRELLLQAHDDENLHEDDMMDSSSELSQRSATATAESSDAPTAASAAWNCSRCTYENTAGLSVCEICGSPRVLSEASVSSTTDETGGGAASAADGKWECSACTLLNPRQAHACVVCNTPNPAHSHGSGGRGRGLSIASALGLFEKGHEKNGPHLGITGDALEELATDDSATVKLVDTLQTITHNLAMIEASSEGGGFGLLLGRPKIHRLKHDPKLVAVLCRIFKDTARYGLEPRLLACQSLNYLIKLDARLVTDGKKAQEWMVMFLAVMDEMARHGDDASKIRRQVAEEAANGLEIACQSHPHAFRDLCKPDSLACLLHFIAYADTLHLNVLLTSLAMLMKVCQKTHFHDKPPRKAVVGSGESSSLGAIMQTLQRILHHANPSVHVSVIKCMTTLFHRTPLHAHLTSDTILQLLHIMVATANEVSHDASRAAVALLTELIDESPLLLTTLLQPDVYEPLMDQVATMLQSESVATSTLRFLTKVALRVARKAGGATNTSDVLQHYLVAFVKANAMSTVSTLLKDGADLHDTPSPLLVAVANSSLAMVRLLVRKGADATGQALHIAAQAKRCDVVSLLLHHGANPTAVNERGETVAQVVAKHPDHPVAKLLAMFDGHDSEEVAHHHHPAPQLALHRPHHHRHRHVREHDADQSHAPPPPAPTLIASASSSSAPPAEAHDDDDVDDASGPSSQQVLLSEFSRGWNDVEMDDDESEHYDDDMHSDEDDDDDEYHDMYGDDEDMSHEEDDDEDDGDDDEESKEEDRQPTDKEGVDEADVTAVVTRADAMRFTHALVTSLVRVVPSIDNKQVTYAVLATLASILVYPIGLGEADIYALLELVHGLLMERDDAPPSAGSSTRGDDDTHDVASTSLNVSAIVLALRLLHAVSNLDNHAAVVAQMERQGILDHLTALAAMEYSLPVEKTVVALAAEWLKAVDPLLPASSSAATNPVVAQLNALCAELSADPRNDALLNTVLDRVEKGVTTYELTKSPVIPTLLVVFAVKKCRWTAQLQALVRHLHQVVGLSETLPLVSHGMPKGKEFYPLTRQLRCRMRLLSQADAPPRSIHASPLTLYSSFERTVFRCASIADPKWLRYAWSLVGDPIWKNVDGKWVEATVCGFDAASGCHLLHLRDDYIEEVLQEESYRLVKTPMKVYASVAVDMTLFGTTPTLKRKAVDDETATVAASSSSSSPPVRRSKRKKKATAGDAVAAPSSPSHRESSTAAATTDEPDDIKSRERRLLDVLKMHDSTSPSEGDKVWITSGTMPPATSICVCGTFVKKSHGLVEVHVSFGAQVNVPLMVDEGNLVSFQAKARPGSTSSKVQRMLGALDSHGRHGGGGGRPVLEQLRKLLSRSRHEPVNADDHTTSPASASLASAKKGKQKAKTLPPAAGPLLTKTDEECTISVPPVVRVLLGYGDYNDKPDDQVNWLTSDDQLNDKAVSVARWLFASFAGGKKPDATTLPEDLASSAPPPVPVTVLWTLADWTAFCKDIKLAFMASEEWMLFSQYASAEHERNHMTWTGFASWLVAICKDARQMKCLWTYLEQFGLKATSFQEENAAPTRLVEFAPDDNLFYCLHKIHPNETLGAVPWKCVFNVYCDFHISWPEAKGTSASLTNSATALSTSSSTSLSLSVDKTSSAAFTQCVSLLQVLHRLYGADQPKETWLNPRLSRKLRMQLQDVLSVTSGTYPAWCDELVQQCTFFFPLEMRYTLFRTTAFGFSRSLHWFRDHLDQESTNEELSISPLPKERAKVDRVDIVKSADAVMKVHGKRKAVLDVVFVGERGYGSGVTAAFYSAVADALQRNETLPLWVAGREDAKDDAIRHPNGLFPQPTAVPSEALTDRFRLMGRLAGKALLDERLLPLPLSTHFLKAVLGEPLAPHDLETIFLDPGRIIFALYKASKAIQSGQSDVRIEKLAAADWLAAVDLNFVDPLTQQDLEPNGSNTCVTTENLHRYVNLVLASWLDRGIAAQVAAFQDGLREIVPLEKLKLLFVDEIQTTLCGSVDVEWTHESLRQTIKLAHGYTSASLPIEYFIQVLVDMTPAQRRAFLLYATGCPHLPPGGVGFEKLKPQFEVVRRVIPDDQIVDVALPFARTCTNTLHLPAYSSQAILAAQLEYAVLNSKGVIDRD
ncbi:Aste57867_223 [Aphanomyces stellatus]|uniref:Aste57867_223 protein n=1 Tax=Aphanomyces stellatus TaxID=120398 RepID=A0A485K676_9STRA|nr:hypothetical protein As57867_000223 [Aphanomyces stellatus]VFT77449.1 Aste57867_223 [Aphanomyces stellatus]